MVIQAFLNKVLPYRDRIKAVVLFGSPNFTPDDDAAVGGKEDLTGPIPARVSTKNARTYCISGDPICNTSASNLKLCQDVEWDDSCPHMLYGAFYKKKAVDYLLSLFKKKTTPKPTGTIVFEEIWTAGTSTKTKQFECGKSPWFWIRASSTFSTAVDAKLSFELTRNGEHFFKKEVTGLHFDPKQQGREEAHRFNEVNYTTGNYVITGHIKHPNGTATQRAEFTVSCGTAL